MWVRTELTLTLIQFKDKITGLLWEYEWWFQISGDRQISLFIYSQGSALLVKIQLEIIACSVIQIWRTKLPLWAWTHFICGNIQGLHPWKWQRCVKAVPIRRLFQLHLTNVALFSLFLEDAVSFAASHIPRFFARAKKKKERRKMVTSHGVDDFRGPV